MHYRDSFWIAKVFVLWFGMYVYGTIYSFANYSCDTNDRSIGVAVWTLWITYKQSKQTEGSSVNRSLPYRCGNLGDNESIQNFSDSLHIFYTSRQHDIAVYKASQWNHRKNCSFRKESHANAWRAVLFISYTNSCAAVPHFMSIVPYMMLSRLCGI